MPQVDLETLVSACAGGSSDRKIACETLAEGDEHPPKEEEVSDQQEIPSDFPPESFWLSKDAELDWFDRNAFYERKDSTKGNSNSTNLNPNINPHPGSNSNSNSQRFSHNLKSKASIIGLPKPQKSCFVEAKNRRHCKQGNTTMFPKRSGSTGKSGAPVIEPPSPKVSCMGRVRSKRDRNRRLKNKQRSAEPENKKEKTAGRRRSGFFGSFRAIFRSGGKHAHAGVNNAPPTESPPINSMTTKIRDIRERLPAHDIDAPRKSVTKRTSDEIESATESVGLGGMKRFSSGRRSESWAVGVDVA